MSYIKQLDTDQAEVTFTLSGHHLFLLKSAGGTWGLSILTPDNEEISAETFEGDVQKRLEVPPDTSLKLSGGTMGAKAWTGKIRSSVGDFI